MELNEALKKVAVLGAAGKMGRGISLLLLQEMCRLEAELHGNVGTGEYSLMLVDMDAHALRSMRRYFRKHLRTYAERNINTLRSYYANHPELVSNTDIINAFIEGALDNVRLSAHLDTARQANMIFEAVAENVDIKSIVMSALSGNAYFFSNTSSVPIYILEDRAELNGKIIGFHFYNPPPVQRLLEIIEPKNMDPELKVLALELAKRLKKTVVYSKDVAGFIGNGHLLRELHYATEKMKELPYPEPEAMQILDTVTRDYLMRPMGIFELLEYVGPDVAKEIAKIMSAHLDEKFTLPEKIERANTEAIGNLPKDWLTWKDLQKHPRKKEIIEKQLAWIMSSDDLGAKLAREYLQHSYEIGEKLVQDGVAENLDDVSTVLQNGFYHLYGLDQITAGSSS